MKLYTLIAALSAVAATAAFAVPTTYQLDPNRTCPSFGTSHAGGLPKWCGKLGKFSDAVALSCATKTGSIDVTMQTNNVDFGLTKVNEYAKNAGIFGVARYPIATFKGSFTKFRSDVPTEAEG